MKLFTILIGVLGVLTITNCGGGSKKPADTGPEQENRAPTANAEDISTSTDTEVNGYLTGADADGDTLTFSLAMEPTWGMLSISSEGQYSYVPNVEYVGMDSFSFTVFDGSENSASAVVTITIAPLELPISSYSREAFNQQPNAEPLAVNGRTFVQDVADETEYDDLILSVQ